MEDKTLVCVDCNESFVFTSGEQEFYSERGLTETPKRCKACRGARRRRLRRRRSSAQSAEGKVAPPPEAAVDAPETPAPEAAANEGNSAPRTFWEERPDWVREAIQKAQPSESGSNGNGEEPRRKKRRRSRRRRRKSNPEASPSESKAPSTGASDDAPNPAN